MSSSHDNSLIENPIANENGSESKNSGLHYLLLSYDQNQEGHEANYTNGITSSDVSVNFDHMGRERSSTIGSFNLEYLRDRGLTFGSEFDLGFGENHGIEHTGEQASETQLPQATIVSASSSNASAPFKSANYPSNQVNDPLKTEHHFKYKGLGAIPQAADGNEHVVSNIEPPSQAFSQNSTGRFVNGISNPSQDSKYFIVSSNTVPGNQKTEFGHTPPTNVPSSYETKHFGKRMRAGSISVRLRSMSDLEDRGIIDNQQKGVLKDLIISGDDALQAALDKYEQGDATELENMINSGALKDKISSDIDLLGDLDLYFLNVNEEIGSEDNAHNDSVPRRKFSQSIPIPIKKNSSFSSQSGIHRTYSGGGSGANTPSMIRGFSPANLDHASYQDDGIGELEFNADYSGGGGDSDIPLPNHRSFMSQQQGMTDSEDYTIKLRSESITDGRFRANSLAFGGLLEEPSVDDQQNLGKWMDRNSPSQYFDTQKQSGYHVVDANGGRYIIQDPSSQKKQGKKSNPKQKSPKVTKEEKAELKRIEKEKKKALKEILKLEKKEQRERESREKKEREAQERLDKKLLKASMNKSKQEGKKKSKNTTVDSSPLKCKLEEDIECNDSEPKEVVSGTGRPRSLSDPNLSIGLDNNGLMYVDGPPDWVGAYSPQSRKIRIERFLAKRHHRVWIKKVKYDVRKNFADSRLRVKGRFVKKEDELLMRDLMSLT
jgi:rRNA-processing protein FCF1